MSMIDTMSIMGIRAFGPNDRDQQVIKFEHPLTLLVGPNGAGKTTIIECLKYATTGEHPQNTKGGAFVHDPKLARESEVRAKVRLRCRNLHGQVILVERGLQAIQKAKNIQFKTLDGVITKERNGEKVSITSKCAELNREMVSTLGVSKAVLDNVIFCHQEESNWPLSEGKSVKQKFDDIFAATRYIKALEEIRKIQKTQTAEMKQENVALEYLESNSRKAQNLQQEAGDYERKLDAAKQSSAGIREKLKPIQQRLIELSKKQSKIIRMDGELGAMRSRHQQMVEDEEKLRKRIRNIFNGTDQQLQDLQQEQGKSLAGMRRNQQECEEKIDPLQREVAKLNLKKNELSVKKGKLEQEIENAEALKKTRNELIRAHKDTYNLSMSDVGFGEILQEQVEEFISVFQEYVDGEKRKVRSQEVRLDAKLKEIDNNFRAVWQEKTEISQSHKHKEEALIEHKRKQAKVKQDLSRLCNASDSGQLDVLQRKLDEAKEDLSMLESSFDARPIHEEIKRLSMKKNQLPKQIESLEREIEELQKSAEIRTKLEMMKNEKKNKEETADKIRSKHQSVLREVGIISSLSSSFPDKRRMAHWISQKDEEIAELQKKLDSEKRQMTQLSTEREMINKEMMEKKRRQEKLDEDLFELCGSQDLESEISRLEKEIQDLQGNKGLTDGIQFMYKKFIKKLNPEAEHDKSQVPCPLCQRLFEETSEIDELVESLQQKLELVPKKLDSQMRELKSKQDRYKLLQDNKPKKLELDRLGREIPSLRQRQSELSRKVNEVDGRLGSLEEELGKMKIDEESARSCLSDVAHLDTLMAEIKELDRNLRHLESRAPMTSSKSLDELNVEKRELSRCHNEALQGIDAKRKELQNHSTSVNEMKEKVNSIQAEKLQLASDLQKYQQLQEQNEVLSGDISRMRSDIEELKLKLEPVERKVESLEANRGRVARENAQIMEEMKTKHQDLSTTLFSFGEKHKSIQKFYASGVERQLKEISRVIEEKVEMRLEQLAREIEEMRRKVASFQKSIVTCTDRQRDLEDNIALREKRNDIAEAEVKVKELESALEGMDAESLTREMTRLDQDRKKLDAEEQRSSARQETWKDELNKTQRELRKDEYRLADERYKQCLVNSVTLDLASQDLSKYYKALDRAIMRFHQIKMDEINKIIRDLWQQTYRGRDINYIEICSSEDTGSSATSRRVFNYRVVMHSDDAVMDMRGRCSAGQKVLASLVIRLALAETFCINCGILALDEPTTNLDRDNIESLAQALVSIIESRIQQRNFQLLVITHDEDFVELLGRARYVDSYLRISKDDRGKSKVTKCDIRTLEH